MCGIVGVATSGTEAAPHIYAALWATQHRGQESAGITTECEGNYFAHKSMGTVDAVFRDGALGRLRGSHGVGHVRYSTAGFSTAMNAQPIEASFRGAPFWIAHNGNLTRYAQLKEELGRMGYRFQTGSDTEVIAALVHFSGQESFENALREALETVEGAYSLVVMHGGKIYGARDPSGKWPLVVGKNDDLMVLASETASCDVIRACPTGEVGPGETVLLDPAAGTWRTIAHHKNPVDFRPCIFESVYFERPDSFLLGKRVLEMRKEMGRRLYQECPVEADIVVPVLDSGKYVALGFSEASGIPCIEAVFRSHYVGRTFIEPLGRERVRNLAVKFNAMPEYIIGKRVVVSDDSLVRGYTAKRFVGMLRECGAREVHMRIGYPIYKFGCHYGIDTGRETNELAWVRCGGDKELMRQETGADSLEFLSLEGVRESITSDPPQRFCDACVTGHYHIPIE